jgi:transposase-like protein
MGKTKEAKKKVAGKKAAKKRGAKGKRYSDEQKKKVVEFVNEVNAKKGRGGVSAATRKFGVTALTISTWVKKSGGATTASKRGSRKSAASVWEQMVSLKSELDGLEKTTQAKRAQFDKLKKRL